MRAADSPLRTKIRSHARATTDHWHRCASEPMFEQPSSPTFSGLCGLQCNTTVEPRRLRRTLTWEDGLPGPLPLPAPLPSFRRPLVKNGKAAPSIVDWYGRGGRACRLEWFCDSFALPIAVNSTHRAAPAFVARSRMEDKPSWLGLMIPKCATTTINKFVQRYNLTSWESRDVLDACSNMSYDSIVQQAVDAAAGGAAESGRHPCPSTACGHAATFDLGPDERRFAVAFVRDPVERFISALDPHGPVGQARASVVKQMAGLTIGSNASAIEVLAARARRIRSRQAFVDDPHVRSQSYYLASTDRVGSPIEWDAIIRLETAQKISQTLVLALLEDYLRWNTTGPNVTHVASDELFASALNAKTLTKHGHALGEPRRQAATLRDAVLSHETLACDLCHLYMQDFACLGYPWPTRCAEPECLATLPRTAQKAITETVSPGSIEAGILSRGYHG